MKTPNQTLTKVIRIQRGAAWGRLIQSYSHDEDRSPFPAFPQECLGTAVSHDPQAEHLYQEYIQSNQRKALGYLCKGIG